MSDDGRAVHGSGSAAVETEVKGTENVGDGSISGGGGGGDSIRWRRLWRGKGYSTRYGCSGGEEYSMRGKWSNVSEALVSDGAYFAGIAARITSPWTL